MDERFKFYRHTQEIHGADSLEQIINEMSGSHFVFLGDDDCLVSSTLELVADVISKKEDSDIITIGFSRFNTTKKQQLLNYDEINKFSGKLKTFNARERAFTYYNSWGIGQSKTIDNLELTHPSGFFLSKRVIDLTKKTQGSLFIKPISDVGYLGARFYTNNIYHLDLPLAIIGFGHLSDAVCLKQRDMLYKRGLLVKGQKNFEYSPIKAPLICKCGY